MDATRNTSRTIKKNSSMHLKSPFAYFGAIDWAKYNHHAVVVDQTGQIVAEFSFPHTLKGWQQWRQQAARYVALQWPSKLVKAL